MTDPMLRWLDEDAYFEDLALIAAGPIHPGGWKGSKQLVSGVNWHGKRVLDIGSGNGFTASLLTSLGAEVFGLEPSPSMRRVAVLDGICPTRILDGRIEDIQNAIPHGPFDILIIEGVAGFVPNFCYALGLVIEELGKPSTVLVADWVPHSRARRVYPSYDITVAAETDPTQIGTVLGGLGYKSSITVEEAVAVGVRVSLEEAIRRVSSFFPLVDKPLVIKAVTRKILLMQNTWPGDSSVQRFILSSFLER